MHPGIKVQFELDLEYAESALHCKQCRRPRSPDSKFPERLPAKTHPPQACGMTIFGGSNKPEEVKKAAAIQNSSVVILLRKNHVAHAISSYRHFTKVPPWMSRADITVPWDWNVFLEEVTQRKNAYEKLLTYIGAAPRTHLIFYEDLKARPAEVWDALQDFLSIPRHPVPNIAELEAKSTSRPSVQYLTQLSELRKQSVGSEWQAMLAEPDFDDTIDFNHEIRIICSRFPAARVSWRGGLC